uniref:Uncharacterized protein n=1 Tax=Escherichia coli TaxID=562 RepID=M1EXU9_ECOLX|nr:hypothetical protein M55_043 [Escherichia coli]AIT41625.1 hypothetical protein pHNAH46_042 [Escherichia coli]AJL34829.1 hypothetical protein [Escherichia coli]
MNCTDVWFESNNEIAKLYKYIAPEITPTTKIEISIIRRTNVLLSFKEYIKAVFSYSFMI